MCRLSKTNRKVRVLVAPILVSMVLALTFVSQACSRIHVVNTPPGVVDKEVALWFQASGATQAWSEASLGLTQAAVSLHSSGVFPDEDSYQKTLDALGKQAQFGLEATNYLKTVPQHFDATAQTKVASYLDSALASLDDATQVGLLQIKDPQAKAQVDLFVTALRSALKTAFAIAKPAGTPLPAQLQQ